MDRQRILITLPTGVAAEVLTSWLKVADRGRLDSAYCNHTLRKPFLDLISCSECTVKKWVLDSKEEECMDNFITWANTRNVSVEKISVGMDSNLNVFDTYFRKSGGGVSAVKAKTTLSRVLKMIAYCPNVVRLDLAQCELSSALHQVFLLCVSLREFRCNFDNPSGLPKSKIKSTDLKGLSCPNLKLMKLEFCKDSALVAAFIKLAVSVEVLLLLCCGPDYVLSDTAIDNISHTVSTLSVSTIAMSAKAFNRLVARCVNIEHFDLSSCNVNPEKITTMGTNLKQLRSVDLSNSNYVKDEIILTLAEVCADTLTELLLCQSYQLSVRAVETVLKKCTNLTSFSVHCEEQGDDPIDLSLLSRCATLSLVYDGEEGSDFVARIAHYCPNLLHLHLHMFDEDFPIGSMDAVVQKCTHLRTMTVEVEEGAGYDDADVARWRAMRPNLVVNNKFTAQLIALRNIS